MTARFEDKDLGWGAAMATIAELAELEVAAGVIGDDEVLAYAPIVEARTGFMRDSIDAADKRLGDVAEAQIGQAIDGDKDAREALVFVGDDAEDVIIEGIEERGLISTGRMRDSITSEVQDATR